ncbi:uncharacterized protein [Montipora foliosa]|uniref:uncharacterized protein n=1 Tax=Montipora foliosa TaxID=591990 RepID=UPI0035F1530A
MEIHDQNCPQYPLLCKNCGKEKISRNKMQEHKEKDCLQAEIKCPFRTVGCLFEGSPSAVSAHVTEQLSSHLSDMKGSFASSKVDQSMTSLRNETRHTKWGLEACSQVQASHNMVLNDLAQGQQVHTETAELRCGNTALTSRFQQLECLLKDISMRIERLSQELTERLGLEACPQVQATHDMVLNDFALGQKDQPSAVCAHVIEQLSSHLSDTKGSFASSKADQSMTSLWNHSQRTRLGLEACPQVQASHDMALDDFALGQQVRTEIAELRCGNTALTSRIQQVERLLKDVSMRVERLGLEARPQVQAAHDMVLNDSALGQKDPPSAVSARVIEQLSSHLSDTKGSFASSKADQSMTSLWNHSQRTRLGLEARPQVQASHDMALNEFAPGQQVRTEIAELRCANTALTSRIQQVERLLKDRCVRVEGPSQELTERLEHPEARVMEYEGRVCNGTYIWRIENYRQCRQDAMNGVITAIYSPAIHTSLYGYKLCMRINLNGVDSGVGRFVALSVHMMQGDYDNILEWPFTGRIALSILDQRDGVEFRQHISETLVAKPNLLAFQRPTAPCNYNGYGYVEFAPIEQIRESQYVKNNTMLVRIQVSR